MLKDVSYVKNGSLYSDCCPDLGVLPLNAVFAAERLLIPVSSDFLSMRGAPQIERALVGSEPVLKRRVEGGCLLTRFGRRRNMSFEIQKRMRAHFGDEFCETVISENVAVTEVPAMNLAIFSHAASSRGAHDYASRLDDPSSRGFVWQPAAGALSV